MFVRSKIIDGKKRRYLVESYRNEHGKPRQRHIAYIDLWPEKDVKWLINLHREYAKALANSKQPGATKVFKQVAAKNAAKLWIDIEKFTRAVLINVTRKRWGVDGRMGPDRHKRQRFHLPPNPYLELLNFFGGTNWNKLEGILERLVEDEHFGAVRNWPADRKEFVRFRLEPTKKRFDELWAELQS
jgi:hypothetical protein